MQCDRIVQESQFLNKKHAFSIGFNTNKKKWLRKTWK